MIGKEVRATHSGGIEPHQAQPRSFTRIALHGEAAKLLLRYRICALPVMNDCGELVGLLPKAISCDAAKQALPA